MPPRAPLCRSPPRRRWLRRWAWAACCVASRSISFASAGRLIPVSTGLPRVASRFGRLGTVSVARKSRSAAALVKRRTVGSIRCLRSARTLPVSYRHALVAFDIGADGGLSNRRVWADLGEGTPDGICADAQNAVWYADVPNERCVRVADGGTVLQTIELDRGGFACALGGPGRTTLFIVAAEWRGMTEPQMVAPGSGLLDGSGGESLFHPGQH
jgi:hypothetical protein